MVARKPIFAHKEDANAREALTLYEAKQYKKALKLVDQNLKKNLSHAESLALKGCCNYQLGHKSEAENYILRALKNGSTNYLVNHLAGIYYRNVENYPEAAIWYKAAVDNGSHNTPILRDLALLQLQTRDYKNLRECRQKYLESQPGFRANWTALAVSHHLNKDFDAAVSTLDKIEGIIKEHLQEQDMYEHSECVLYKISIIFETGNVARALEELEAKSDEIRDRLSFLEMKANFLLLLGKQKEASLIYRQLLQRNPDQAAYYQSLEIALGTSNEAPEIRLKLYDKLSSFYPRADPPKILPLSFLPASHPEFKKRAADYVLTQLKRGVPAAFVNIKPFYNDHNKASVILSIVQEFFENEINNFPPPVFVWANYFLAQHYLYVNQLDEALCYIDTALEHTPTLVELYILKARIVKHSGDFIEASNIMQKGRSLDLQDRFINSKATKYLFRANKVEEAIDCVSLFTKNDDDAANGLGDLQVMQSNWTLVESAEGYSRLYYEQCALAKQEGIESEKSSETMDLAEIYLGLALKRFMSVLKVFQVYENDQFDYHSYCMRVGTTRDYIEMVKWEDKLHSTPIYVRAIRGFTKLLQEVHVELLNSETDETVSKEKKKRNVKKIKQINVKKKNEVMARVQPSPKDEDPLGQRALNEFREANKLLSQLESLVKQLSLEAANYLFTWDLAYDFYKHEKKYVLALQALRSWSKIVDPQNKKLRVVGNRVLDLQSAVEQDGSVNVAIAKVVQKGLESAFPELSEGQENLLNVYSH